MILNNSELNKDRLMSTEAVLPAYYCRLFKHFLCPSKVRGANNFINEVKNKYKDAQVTVVYSARHWCESNDYKTIKPAVFTKQFNFAKPALSEEKNFLRLIGSITWPSNMEETRYNLLKSTAFDADLYTNVGNDFDVLKCLWDTFKFMYLAKAKIIQTNTNSINIISPVSFPSDLQKLPATQPEVEDPATTATLIEADAEELKSRQEHEEKQEELRREKEKRLEALKRHELLQKPESFLSDSCISTQGHLEDG